MRAVRRRAPGGGGDPGAAALGQADLQLARLADDAGVLVEQPRSSSTFVPCSPRAPRRRRGGTSACPPARSRRDGSPRRGERRRDRALHVGGAPADQPAVLDVALPGTCRQVSRRLRRARRRGGRSTRASAVRPSRSTRPRSAGRRRRGRSRAIAPSAVRMSAATAAASSSVPPGFSQGAAIRARANASTSSGSTAGAAGGASATASSTMALDGTRRRRSNGAARFARSGSDPRSRRARATAWRPCWRRSSSEPEPRSCSPVRSAAMSSHAGEISFPGGLQDPGETLVETALREAHEEIGLEPAAVGAARRPARPSTRSVSGDPRRAVRRHAGRRSRRSR